MLEINLKDVVQMTTFLILLGTVFWRFSNVLGDIKTELRLIMQKLEQINPQLLDHEHRIRELEKKCNEDK